MDPFAQNSSQQQRQLPLHHPLWQRVKVTLLYLASIMYLPPILPTLRKYFYIADIYPPNRCSNLSVVQCNSSVYAAVAALMFFVAKNVVHHSLAPAFAIPLPDIVRSSLMPPPVLLTKHNCRIYNNNSSCCRGENCSTHSSFPLATVSAQTYKSTGLFPTAARAADSSSRKTSTYSRSYVDNIRKQDTVCEADENRIAMPATENPLSVIASVTFSPIKQHALRLCYDVSDNITHNSFMKPTAITPIEGTRGIPASSAVLRKSRIAYSRHTLCMLPPKSLPISSVQKEEKNAAFTRADTIGDGAPAAIEQHREAKLEWLLRVRGGFQIQVKTMSGKSVTLDDVEATDKILDIKRRVEAKEGIPVDQQRLVYNGRQLQNEKTAADYDIKEDAVVHLVLRLRGGDLHQQHYCTFNAAAAAGETNT